MERIFIKVAHIFVGMFICAENYSACVRECDLHSIHYEVVLDDFPLYLHMLTTFEIYFFMCITYQLKR